MNLSIETHKELTMKNTNTQPILCGTDFSGNARQAADAHSARPVLVLRPPLP